MGRGIYLYPCTSVHVFPTHFVVLFLALLLVEYSMLGFETCNTFQTCIEHAHKGNNIWLQLLKNYVHLNDMHTLTISYCSIVLVSATRPTVFDVA